MLQETIDLILQKEYKENTSNECTSNTMGIVPKLHSNIVSKESLREVQKNTMQTIADALQRTYGPLGSNSWLITGSDKQSLRNEFSKDGRTVLKKILFLDPIEMAIQTEIEDIALYTDKEVGDGTTSATLISNAVFQRFYEYEKTSDLPPYTIINGFKNVIKQIQEKIKNRAIKDISPDIIYDICMISTNGNTEVSEQITNIYKTYGIDVFIDVKTSNDADNKIKVYDGLTVDEGYSDPAYINTKDGTCSIRNARVYYFADPIDTPDMVSLFETIIFNNIIDPINSEEGSVIPTVIVSPKITSDASSLMRQVVEFMYKYDHNRNVEDKPPLLVISNIGYRSEQMDDIAQLCGCKVIHRYIDPKIQKKDVDAGLAPTLETVCDFYGECDIVEADIVATKFINPKYMHKRTEDGMIEEDENGNLVHGDTYNSILSFLQAELNNAIENNEDSSIIGRLRRRLNSLKANMVEYQIGGISISDRDSVMALVVDAVKNCRSASKNGIGHAANFEAFICALDTYEELKDDKVLGPLCKIICDAYLDIIRLLYSTVFENPDDIIKESLKLDIPYNIATGKHDGKVITSIDTDIKILDTISKIVSLMLTSNQVIIQHPNLNKY